MKIIELKKVSLYSNVLMLLTSLHHIYGAVIYQTPWRLHVLLISIPVILLTFILQGVITKRMFPYKSIVFWIYLLIILIASIGLIGSFEGLYNHLLKNIMFYGGVNKRLLLEFFPPPTYQLPDDFLFEFTGILQAIVVIPLVFHFIKLTKTIFKQLTHPVIPSRANQKLK